MFDCDSDNLLEKDTQKHRKYSVPDVPIAFFDLDHTILHQDTNLSWILWRIKSTCRGLLEFLVGLRNYIYYKHGRLTARKISFHYRARTLGISSEKYKKMSYDFFHEHAKHLIVPEAIQLISAHQKMGNYVVLITTQDDYIAYHFFSYLNMDNYISNKWIVENNKFVGLQEPNCYGKGKTKLARVYAKDLNVNLEDCAFYSDSVSDLPLLDIVKHPIAINPDFWLEKVAVDSNWPIYKFEH